MSNPEDIREQLSAYLDGELGEDDARRVEEAVRAEPALEQELEQLRTTRQLIHALPHAPAPDGFTGRVISHAERRRLMHQLPGARPYRSFRWITLAAAAVVLLAAGMGMFLLVTIQAPPVDGTAGAGGGGAGSTRPAGPLVALKPETAVLDAASPPKGGLKRSSVDASRVGKGGGSLAGAAFQDDASTFLTIVENVEINTTDIATARREVARLLVDNKVDVMSLTRPEVQGQQEQLIVYNATEAQLANVRTGLRALQSRQNVPQKPVLSQLNELVALNKALAVTRRARHEKARDGKLAEAAQLALVLPEPPALPGPPARRPAPAPPASPAGGPASADPSAEETHGGRKSTVPGRTGGTGAQAAPEPTTPEPAAPTVTPPAAVAAPAAKPAPTDKPPLVLPSLPRTPKPGVPAPVRPKAPETKPKAPKGKPPAPKIEPPAPKSDPLAPSEGAPPAEPSRRGRSAEGTTVAGPASTSPAHRDAPVAPVTAPTPGEKKASPEGEAVAQAVPAPPIPGGAHRPSRGPFPPRTPEKRGPGADADTDTKNGAGAAGSTSGRGGSENVRGGQAGPDPAPVVPAIPAGPPAPAATLQTQWEDLLHHVRIGNTKAAESYAKAILASGADPKEVYRLSERHTDSLAVLERGSRLEGMKPLTDELRKVIDKGHVQLRMAPEARQQAQKKDTHEQGAGQTGGGGHGSLRPNAQAMIITVNYLPDGIGELQRDLNRQVEHDQAEQRDMSLRERANSAAGAPEPSQPSREAPAKK